MDYATDAEVLEREVRALRRALNAADRALRAAVAAKNEAEDERDAYRETLTWIADHSQEFTQEVHGYTGYGQALGAVHDRARRAVELIAASKTEPS